MTTRNSTAAGVSRRTVLKTVGASALVPWLSDAGLLAFADIQQRQTPPAPLAIPAGQFSTLETLVEAIIPGDERSPGARAARVADYIDLLMSEAEPEPRELMVASLSQLDAESVARYGRPFADLDAASLEVVMHDISRNEHAPASPLEHLFATVKRATIHGYYTSEVGIHQELRYKGNQFLPEFVGCETVDGRDCPHCGQRHIAGEAR